MIQDISCCIAENFRTSELLIAIVLGMGYATHSPLVRFDGLDLTSLKYSEDLFRWLVFKVGSISLMPTPLCRGYIPNVFAFKNPYPLNPKKSDLFYFLLIRTKQSKSPKFQRAVSSSSELHVIQRIPRDTTTLAFLLIL